MSWLVADFEDGEQDWDQGGEGEQPEEPDQGHGEVLFGLEPGAGLAGGGQQEVAEERRRGNRLAPAPCP
jgi:hypothetical protein